MRMILAIGFLLGTLAFAQNSAPKAPTDDSMYISETQMETILQKGPSAFSTRLFDGGSYSTAFIRLDAPDTPHAHGLWSEVLIIKEGSATLQTGGRIVGDVKAGSAVHQSIFTDADGNPRPQAQQANAPAAAAAPRRVPAGDIQGSAIEGGHKQEVKPGDIILIPAGVAHAFLRVDKSVVYLDIKFPKTDTPAAQ